MALARLEEKAGFTRGTIEILDRGILEQGTCECYRIIAAEYRRLTVAAPSTRC